MEIRVRIGATEADGSNINRREAATTPPNYMIFNERMTVVAEALRQLLRI